MHNYASTNGATSSAGETAYEDKPGHYFDGAREDFVFQLPRSSDAKILEIGCGSGATGRLAIAQQKCARYCGVELCRAAAEAAARHLDEVVHGDIENVMLPWPEAYFDVIIMSEVLEHLADPAAVLRRVRPLLKPEAIVLASSPNVAHYSVVAMLLRGKWRVSESGLMDRTHLRWFTPESYREMFEAAGYEVEDVYPVTALGYKARVAVCLLLGRGQHLFIRQMALRARRCRDRHSGM